MEHGSEQALATVGIEGDYPQQLRQCLLYQLGRQGLSFALAVRFGAGAYPTDVRDALQSMVAERKVTYEDGIYHLGKPTWSFREAVVQDCDGHSPPSNINDIDKVKLADPHPADYDWRFTPSALKNLVERLRPCVESGAKIALLGTTTLFPQLATTTAKVTLFDRSASLVRDLRVAGFTQGLVEHDLFDPIPRTLGRFDAVVADPPWYPAFHRAFLLRGAEILRSGGILLLSVLPWLTRPSAIADRGEILRFAHECGLDLAEAAAGQLLYESPKFERVALAMHNIYCGDWRGGDLFVFRKVGEPSPLLDAPRPDDEPSWEEYILGNRKIKLRVRPEPSYSGFGIEKVGDSGRYLGTVSRRSPDRAKIDLWTSDNLAYSVKGLEVLRCALARLAAGDPRDSIADDAIHTYHLTATEASLLTTLLGEVSGKDVGW